MRKIKISFLVVALSLMVTGMAFAIDIPNITTWTQSMGVGGGGAGRGDVLIGALYDVRDLTDTNLPAPYDAVSQAQQTLISIVNTDPVYGVIARLRFREWKRSHECLDFDIPLTSNDVWVAEVSRLATGGAVLNSPDRWITNIPTPVPTGSPFYADLISTTDFGLGVGGGIPFRAQQVLQFEPTLTTAQALERCEYGYFEVIGEERFASITKAATWTIPRITAYPCVASATFDCRDVQDVLMGTAFIIRPDQAISHQYNMNALSDFAVDSNGIYDSPLTPRPNLEDNVQGELVAGNVPESRCRWN